MSWSSGTCFVRSKVKPCNLSPGFGWSFKPAKVINLRRSKDSGEKGFDLTRQSGVILDRRVGNMMTAEKRSLPAIDGLFPVSYGYEACMISLDERRRVCFFSVFLSHWMMKASSRLVSDLQDQAAI